MKTLFLGVVLFSRLCFAGELADIKMPDQDSVQGHSLVLNGMTYREVSVLGILIKVYVGGLYVAKKSSNGDEILSSKSLKQMRTTFKHRASAGEVANAWKESFDRVCKEDCAKRHDEHINEFKKFFKTVKSGETLFYNFTETGIEVFRDTEKWGEVKDGDFAKVVLGVWIGKNAVSEFMKKGLLGL